MNNCNYCGTKLTDNNITNCKNCGAPISKTINQDTNYFDLESNYGINDIQELSNIVLPHINIDESKVIRKEPVFYKQ